MKGRIRYGRGRTSAMVKRERIWLAFNVNVGLQYGGGASPNYVSLFGGIDWSPTIAGSQTCTLMGLIYSLSWDCVGTAVNVRYAITVDEFNAAPAVTDNPGAFGFQLGHDILHEGIVCGVASGGAIGFPQLEASQPYVPEGMVRVKARRIISNNQAVNFWVPGLVNRIVSAGVIEITGRALILRHG